MITFICDPCASNEHWRCKGGTACDCQHRPTKENPS